MAQNRTKSYSIDMCSGPILPKLLRFTIPLICSSMLQLLFNTADIIVVAASPATTLWPPWAPPPP